VKMQKFLAAAATVFLMSAGAAYASPLTVTGTYSLSYSATTGNGPSFTDDGNRFGIDPVTLSSPFTESLNVGSPTANAAFFTATPAGSCANWPASCGLSDTAKGTITVTFSFTTPTGATGELSDTGTYTADYQNLTDSIVWNSPDPLVVDFADGAVLDITLVNASDWSITPDISFDLTKGPSATPLPATLPLFVSGLGGLGLLGWRKKRKTAAVAV
jgi:hypothetical protein